LALDLGDLGLPTDVDAGVFHPGSEYLLDGRVESSEDSVTADEEVGLGSEGVEDAGELDGNVTGSDHNDPLRLVFELKETIRADTEACSGDFLIRGNGWMAAYGDADVIGLDSAGPLAGFRDLDLGGGKDGCVTSQEVDTLPVPITLVDAAEFLNVSVALKFKSCPVKLLVVYAFELVSGRLMKLVCEICGMPHQLLWDTTWKEQR
jgi:hypothetical protein